MDISTNVLSEHYSEDNKLGMNK